jgi:hypothetical protein
LVSVAGLELINKFMPTLYTLVCKHCKSNFTALPRNKHKKFCNKTCAKESVKNHNILDNCLVCKATLNKRLQKKFCSASCSATYNNSLRSVDSRIKQKNSLQKTLLIKGKNRSDPKEKYYAECSFKRWPKKVWLKLPGFDLIKTLGIFHPTNNPNGVVRDHIISKNYGWKHSIDPSIISHPANCQIINNYQNIKKGTRSDLFLSTLLEEIDHWESKFGANGRT